MVVLGYNTGVNHIKSDGLFQQHRHPFSSRIRGANTMPDHTLPLFSLQPETKEIPLTQGKVAIVDAADYEWLMQWKWCASSYCKTWYARRSIVLPDGRKSTVKMHRVIMGATNPGIEIDHKNGDGLDNTRGNLREATRGQNQFNTRIRSDNVSGYKGVDWYNQRGKWRAQIRIGGKTTYLGLFVDIRDAVAAYDNAARELFGEFARTNADMP